MSVDLSDPPSPICVQASLTGRRWVWREADSRIGLALAQRLDLPELVGRLLAGRGIGLDDAADFLAPTLRALLPDPSVLADMAPASERLAAAVRAGETIAVYGDYDVDGACSGALAALVLGGLGCPILSYVPDRLAEGYGPNAPALRGLMARGASVILCVDCGTAADHVFAAIATPGVDIIVLDHHTAPDVPRTPLATVNPNRLDCRSGLGTLCAAAVVFMTLVATLRVLRRDGFFADRAGPDLRAALDLVALATVCDVMPLVGLNRAFVTQGLKVMARRERIGIAALLDAAGAQRRPDAMTLGFALGPRINAAGRISEADLGLRLLLAQDPMEAQGLAASLDAVNRQRQSVEEGMLDAAMDEAASQIADGHVVVLVAGAEWHPGVVGIVAGRIKERFNRPACVAGITDGLARGSGRSVVGVDLGGAVIAAGQHGLLASGGGHAMAAGFAVKLERLTEFHAFLDSRLAHAADLPPAADLAIDGALSVAGCTAELAGQLGRLAPFGNGNPEPVMVLRRVRVVRAERVGRELATIRAFIEGEGGGPRLKTMLFRAKEGRLAEALMDRAGAPLHLAGCLRAEEWNGVVSAGFFVTDAAAS